MKRPELSQAELDRINLAQSLRDFETANARVLDLTQRLLESERQRKSLADELERLRLKMGAPGQRFPSLGLSLLQQAGDVARKAVKKASGLLDK